MSKLILISQGVYNQISGFLNEEEDDFLGAREMSAEGKAMYPGRAFAFDEASWNKYKQHLRGKGLDESKFQKIDNTEDIFPKFEDL